MLEIVPSYKYSNALFGVKGNKKPNYNVAGLLVYGLDFYQ